MTRLLLAVLIAATFLCAVLYAHHRNTVTGHQGPSDVTVGAAQVVASPVVQPPIDRRPHLRRASHPACTDTHWKRTLGKQERWIDAHESGLNPASREPSTGAFGLGQLEPQTYARLGLPMDPSPCREIQAQRAYMVERYGTWGNALAHWRAVSWW